MSQVKQKHLSDYDQRDRPYDLRALYGILNKVVGAREDLRMTPGASTKFKEITKKLMDTENIINEIIYEIRSG